MGKNIIMKELVRYHMVFTGRVQGVGFRYKANLQVQQLCLIRQIVSSLLGLRMD